MTGQALAVAWYRFRATFGHRRGGYLAIVLLVGLVGGVAMGALAAARRTQSSFATYLASTNPSNFDVSVFGGFNNSSGAVYSAAATKEIAALPGVRHVEAGIVLTAAPLLRNGAPRLDSAVLQNTFTVASVDGLYFDLDRLAVTEGRMANPDRPDEIVMTAVAAHLLGFHVGEVIPYGFYTQHQQGLPAFGTPKVPPHRRIDEKLVGLVQVSNALVQDDIDRLPTFIFFTPALGKEVVADGGHVEGGAITYGLQIDGGNAGVAKVEREFSTLVPRRTTAAFHAISPVEAKVDRTVKPLAIALGVFGMVAALAALLIGVQIISRQLRAADEDLGVLRALGATPGTTIADGLLGMVGAITVGALLAVLVAVALSPLSPLGPVRSVYPGSAIAFDWTVLGSGLAALIVGLGALALALAYRSAPHRVAQRQGDPSPRGSRAVRVVASTGLPPSAAVGVRFALESGRGRTAVPVRSALLGAVLAVALVVATLTFGSGLQALVSHPSLYGWNWTYMLNPTNTVPSQAEALLAHDHDVATWAGYDYNDAEINGQTVPFLFQDSQSDTSDPIAPPILSGHGVEDKDQIVLGAATMQQLHTRLGGTVVVSFGLPKDAPFYLPPTPVVVVGTATMPAVGFSSVISDHTSMGTGALVSRGVEPAAFQKAQLSGDPTLNGPDLIFVRLRGDVPRAVGLAGLRRIAASVTRDLAAVPNGGGQGNSVTAVGVQRPAEIVNYRSTGATPTLLATALAAGAVIALGLTLAASVRRRRRDLALLKTLGFTQRQLAAALAWQASVAAVIGVVVGVPVGIALGRWLWDLFARQIYAVPDATVPVVSVVVVALGALVLANIVAALPGRSAARTPTAVLLRSE
ncbi:MAG TPA: FtsX-like permease family protein [Acidimicrobiales bacterium]